VRSLRLVAAAAPSSSTAACTDDDADADGSPTGPSASGTAPVDLAGAPEAEALAPLPAGPATGTAVLVFSGLGELRAPFTGQCSHEGSTTRIDGSADTARIVLDVTPDGARITLDDADVTSTSELATGRYDVTGSHLSLRADMRQGGEPAGSAELEIDCGG
jgi:hypothetical protein